MKKYLTVLLSTVMAFSLVACVSNTKAEGDSTTKPAEAVATQEENKEIKINYLGQEYNFEGPVENVVLASLEGMEDAAVLGVDAVGVLEIAGAVPTYLADNFKDVALIGDKKAPNAEAILGTDPDVIIGTSKWSEEIMAKMNKMAVTLPYSHISSNWKDNILALGEITGKADEANKLISDYEAKASEAKEKISKELANETVLVIRVRAGVMNIYPADTYLNPVLYTDLGLTAPEVLAGAKAQAELTLETLAEINPTAIFLQFETSENTDNANSLNELLENQVFQSLDASKNDKVFVNSIEPLAQGGTAWSKVRFLDAVVDNLLK